MERTKEEQEEYDEFMKNERLNRQQSKQMDTNNEVIDTNITLFNTLLNDPNKRKQVLELLTQGGFVKDVQKKMRRSLSTKKTLTTQYFSPIREVQKKFQIESPSQRHRRLALEKMNTVSSSL